MNYSCSRDLLQATSLLLLNMYLQKSLIKVSKILFQFLIYSMGMIGFLPYILKKRKQNKKMSCR